MKTKVLNILLILTSLIDFLEWGKDQKQFLFQLEGEIINKFFSDPISVLHPFTLLPFFGQIMLLITLFQSVPSRIMTYIGITCLGLLLGFMFVIGLISLDFKILISTIPFLVTSFMTIKQLRSNRKINPPVTDEHNLSL